MESMICGWYFRGSWPGSAHIFLRLPAGLNGIKASELFYLAIRAESCMSYLSRHVLCGVATQSSSGYSKALMSNELCINYYKTTLI